MEVEKKFYTETKEIRPITIKHLFVSSIALIGLERGFLYTALWMIKHPRNTIVKYFGEERFIISNPFRMTMVLVAFATLIATKSDLFGNSDFSAGFADGAGIESEQVKMFQKRFYEFMVEYFNVITFATLPLMAISTKLIFPKSGYNYAEHLVINTFIMSVSTLLFIILVGIGLITSISWAFMLYTVIALIYQVYAYASIFYTSLLMSTIKSSFAVALQYLFMVIIVILAMMTFLYFNPEYLSK